MTKENTHHIVVMGVSGTGKTSIAHALRDQLGWSFIEGDDLHPNENIQKMSAGIPLTDEDRAPWLARISTWIKDAHARGERTVVTCSALKRAYRDVLREAAPGVLFVHLTGPRETIANRMKYRQGHFMPTSLLDSQFATLEPLEADEAGVLVDISGTPEEVATAALAALSPTL
ncbi:MAG TPA: gluconokinase [Candidatus Rothia avicola]|uniref:Gluconokinase n=1 Tax=Candidatus Rothia avicola TaxID=2840478 RepID=A0A9D1ZRP3_9MICC|nr:gluconokinase [Candidatus Rothia avicola]